MHITVLDDYQNTIRTLACFGKVAGHHVTIWNDHTTDVDVLAMRLKDTEALALIRERTPIRASLIERLDKLRIISQVSVYPHIDIDACTRRGVLVSSLTGPGQPSYATSELTWGLIIAAVRHIPQEMAALRSGKWQAFPIGTVLRGKTLGIYGYGKSLTTGVAGGLISPIRAILLAPLKGKFETLFLQIFTADQWPICYHSSLMLFTLLTCPPKRGHSDPCPIGLQSTRSPLDPGYISSLSPHSIPPYSHNTPEPKSDAP
jgi:hypothetical protein